MGNRIDLHNKLKAFGTDVYFQPKQNITLVYPCIVYERDDSWVTHANNNLYRSKKQYQVTVIDRDPDSQIPDMVEALPLSRLSRAYQVDGLYHTSFNIFF